MTYIEQKLDKWCPNGGYESYRLYELMLNSDYKVLPWSGGWLSQEKWWLDDVEMFFLNDEWIRLNETLPAAPGRGAPQSKNDVSEDDDG